MMYIIGVFNGLVVARDSIRREALSAGVAEYCADKDGNIEFKFKKIKC
jgi:hypothetical protein